ncbi:MAG: IS200/IS605 family element transposase accessory protein TnpB [Candidatus Heimdallarchaeota archaeon]|nr:IS200/IS605 family element transposase accessory protein TnpB [Candidatus Heimdallarchaeota archaeon]
MSILIRTLRVPVFPDDKSKEQLKTTFKEYSKAAQTAFDYANANNTTNRIKVHHGIYKSFRKQSSLNSQLVINAKNKAMDVIRSLKAKKKQRNVKFMNKIPIRYDYRSSTINQETQSVSLATTGKRINLEYILPGYCQKYSDWEFRSFELLKKGDKYYLHFVVRKYVKASGEHSGEFIGIDRGIRHIAVTSQNQFYNGSRLREIKNRYFRLKRGLQKKGTRSAKRKLKKTAGKEKRFQKDQNHCISKDIINNLNSNSTIILEDLSEIRKTAKYRKKSRQGRELNSWGFYQFQIFLEYKGKENNIEVVYVDPAYTSQRCNMCGYISKKNRSGANFSCLSCGFGLNADLNASRNIEDKYFDDGYVLYELAQKAKGFLRGAPVIIPNVAS